MKTKFFLKPIFFIIAFIGGQLLAAQSCSITGAIIICPGSSTTYTAGYTNPPAGFDDITYEWSTGAATESISVSNPGTYLVTITFTNPGGMTQSCNAMKTLDVYTVSITSSGADMCVNQTRNLEATPAGGSFSVTGPGSLTGTTLTATGVGTIKVTYTATVVPNCTITDEQDIVVTASPTASAMATPNEVCEGKSFVLSGSGGGGGLSYMWTGPNFSAPGQMVTRTNATESMEGTYTLTVTSSGCTSTASVFVTVNPLPVANAGTDSNICGGTSATLDATASGGTGSYSFLWTVNGMTLGDPASTGPLTTQTTFTVTVTDSKGCTDTDQVVISTTGPAVTLTPSNPVVVCQGIPVQLNASASGSGTLTYAWSPGTGLSSTTIPNPIATAPLGNTTYTVTVTDGNNCKNSKSVQITVNPNPSVVITGTTAICSGQNTTLIANASGGQTPYVYGWSPSGNTPMVTVSPTSTTQYVVTVTDANNCAGNMTTTVNVNPVVSLSIQQFLPNPPGPICPGDPVRLKATVTGGSPPDFTYVWSNSLGTNDSTNIFFPTTINPTYSLTVSDPFMGTQCLANATFTVTFKPSVLFSGTGPTQAGPYCEGATIMLNANSSNASGSATYQWSGPASNINAVAAPSITNATVAMSGTYTVNVTDAGKCSNTGSVNVLINQDPSVDLIIVGANIICFNGSAVLKATPSVISGVTASFKWQKKNANGVFEDINNVGSGSQATLNNITTTTVYRVISNFSPLSSNCNQATSNEVTVVVINDPQLQIIGPTVVCKNQQALYYLKSDYVDQGDFTWTVTGGTVTLFSDPTLIAVQWGNNSGTVSVTQTIGSVVLCEWQETINVNVTGGPAPDPSTIGYYAPNNILICKDNTADCYQWGYYDKDTKELITLPNEMFQAYGAGSDYRDTSRYVYWVKTWNGNCASEACATVSFRTVPVTSNAPEAALIKLYPNPNEGEFLLEATQLPTATYSLNIFDAWGRLVHEQQTNVGADGYLIETIRMGSQPNGLYFSVLRLDREIYFTRKFTLMR